MDLAFLFLCFLILIFALPLDEGEAAYLFEQLLLTFNILDSSCLQLALSYIAHFIFFPMSNVIFLMTPCRKLSKLLKIFLTFYMFAYDVHDAVITACFLSPEILDFCLSPTDCFCHVSTSIVSHLQTILARN